MKLSLLGRLRCPCCNAALELNAIHSDAEEVREGVLSCASSCSWYPIINHVPVLLDFPTPLYDDFKKRFGSPEGSSLPLPSGEPRQGEIDIQRSFTVEWSGLGQNPYTFAFSVEQREEHLKAELDWPPSIRRRPDEQSFLTLDVGAGFGLEPIYLTRAIGGEVIGIDLNLSLLNSGPLIARAPNVHTIIASLFAPPFEERSFDLVYSNGVIHHTYSTEAAFRSIERFRKPDGSIYVWVYASEDFFQLSWKGKIQHTLEAAFRPAFSKLPAGVQNVVLYPLAFRNMVVGRRMMKRGKEWTLKNALHETRDKWTPRFAYRHRFNEVLRWFSEAGLDARPTDPAEIQKHLPISVIGVGVRGTGRRAS